MTKNIELYVLLATFAICSAQLNSSEISLSPSKFILGGDDREGDFCYCQEGMTGVTFTDLEAENSKSARFFGVIDKQKAKLGATDLKLFLAINKSKFIK